jgi:hypothetical protein
VVAATGIPNVLSGLKEIFKAPMVADPGAKSGITGAIYSQFLPFVPEPALQLYMDFEAALYASL